MVNIDTFGVFYGEYALVLQSYDMNGSKKSTLKEDIVKIIVTGVVSSFTSELTIAVLTTGKPIEWILPEISAGAYPLAEIIVEPEVGLAAYIEFNS